MTTDPAKPALKGVSYDKIQDLLANTRQRNQYGPRLIDFDNNSDELAVNPAEVWPEFKNKNAATLYQGFRNAAEKAGLSHKYLIKKNEDVVFIIHKERLHLHEQLIADSDD